MATYLEQVAFVRNAIPAAVITEQKYGVPALVTLTQAAFESAWGKRLACGTNYFGHKAAPGEPYCLETTQEVYGGKTYTVKEKFRKYASKQEGLLAHGAFLRNNSRYSKAFLEKTPEKFLEAVFRAGYATQPDYMSRILPVMQMIRNIIRDNKLSLTTGNSSKPVTPKAKQSNPIPILFVVALSSFLGYKAFTYFKSKSGNI
jgi:flagellar protein FlgJ